MLKCTFIFVVFSPHNCDVPLMTTQLHRCYAYIYRHCYGRIAFNKPFKPSMTFGLATSAACVCLSATSRIVLCESCVTPIQPTLALLVRSSFHSQLSPSCHHRTSMQWNGHTMNITVVYWGDIDHGDWIPWRNVLHFHTATVVWYATCWQ